MPVNHMASTRHKWPEDRHAKIFLAQETRDGLERHERTCIQCGMTRITVIPPVGWPWHEWRTKDGPVWVGEATPPCLFVVVKQVAKPWLKEAS